MPLPFFKEAAELMAAITVVVVPVAGVAVAYARLSLNAALGRLKLDMHNQLTQLMTNLNGTYVRRGECVLVHDSVKDRLDRMEKDLARLVREVGGLERDIGELESE